MENHYLTGQSGIIEYERIVAKIYCFVLPIRMISQLSFLKNIFFGCAFYLPFVFHLVGLILWGCSEGWKPSFGEKRDLLQKATLLVIWLNISSVIMASIIQIGHGNQGSENAFQGIAGMIVYFCHYFLMIVYNYRVFKLLPLEDIRKILHSVCVLLLIIGYVQVLVMNGIGASIYDNVNFLGILNSSSRLPKLCLTGSEGAGAGGIIGILVLPFLFSQIVNGKRKYILESLMWLIPIFYTYSSTAYILVVIDVLVLFCILIIRAENRRRGIQTVILVLLCLSSVLFALRITKVLDEDRIEQIRYLLFEKSTDSENGSTVSRTVPLLVNWGAFTEYPFFGVGNGLQGYFYEKYFPAEALTVAGSDVGMFLDKSREGISNGGIFFPSLLSGYGIFGCTLILLFIWQNIQENRRNRYTIGEFYYLYILSGIAVVFSGFQGDFYGKYYLWFLLSIPFITTNETTLNNQKGKKNNKYRYIKSVMSIEDDRVSV